MKTNLSKYAPLILMGMMGPQRKADSSGNTSEDGGGFVWYLADDEEVDYHLPVGSGSIASRPRTLSRDALRTRSNSLLQKQME